MRPLAHRMVIFSIFVNPCATRGFSGVNVEGLFKSGQLLLLSCLLPQDRVQQQTCRGDNVGSTGSSAIADLSRRQRWFHRMECNSRPVCTREERALRCPLPFQAVRRVQTKLMDCRLLLARGPPSCILDVLLHRRDWGLFRWRLVRHPPLRDRAASDQGPGHLAVLTGSSLHGGP